MEQRQPAAIFAKQDSLSKTSQHFLVNWMGWGSDPATSLLDWEQHICSSFLSQTWKTFINVSPNPPYPSYLWLTCCHPHRTAPARAGIPVGKQYSERILFPLCLKKSCSSVSFSAQLQMAHSPPDQMSEGKRPFLFHRSPRLSRSGKSLTHSLMNQMQDVESHNLKTKVFQNILKFITLKKT